MISRKDAVAAGLKWYFTGKPCKNGHTVPRSVGATECPECGRTRVKLKRRERYNNDPQFRDRTLEANQKYRTNPESEYNNKVMKSYFKRMAESETARAKKKIRMAIDTKRNQAKRAAKFLTETLGVPHGIVESVDASGDRTFQPVAKSSLPGKVDG